MENLKVKVSGTEEEAEQTVKEVSRQVLWSGHVKKLTVTEYWDSHGNLVYWHKMNKYKDVDISFERVSREYTFFGSKPYTFTSDELKINGEVYRALDIASLSGTTEKALAQAIIGQG